MTVGELIKILQALPQDMLVLVDGGPEGDLMEPEVEVFDGNLTGYEPIPFEKAYYGRPGTMKAAVIR